MSERHDPLSTCGYPQSGIIPGSATKKLRQKKAPALLREIAKIPDETLVFLYANQIGAHSSSDLRSAFTAYCEANLHFSNWRSAWAAFAAQTKVNSGLITRQGADRLLTSLTSAARKNSPKISGWRRRLKLFAVT